MKKVILAVIFGLVLFGFSFTKPVNSFASEGTFDIRSTTSESYYCWAASLFMPYNKYRLIVGCVDLVYPPKPPDFYKYYILWATPTDKSKPMRLGELAGGKGEYLVPKPFSELFVTLEVANNIKGPSNMVVMRGATKPINSLLRPPTATPTEKIQQNGSPTTSTPTEKNTVDTSQLSLKDKLFLALRRAGIAAVVALVVIIGLVFVVSRSRG